MSADPPEELFDADTHVAPASFADLADLLSPYWRDYAAGAALRAATPLR